ncbi:MAG: hypothetical protein AB1489_12105 [Acidobacteriota bacterium]
MHNLNSISWRKYFLAIGITVTGGMVLCFEAGLNLKTTAFLVGFACLKETHSFLLDARKKLND